MAIRVPQSTIVDQALDLVDGIYGLVDIAFSHDLAVVFSDIHGQELATSITGSLITLTRSIHGELAHRPSLGSMCALLGTTDPFVGALHELLLDAGHQLGTRAVFAVMRTRRPIELAFAHLRATARLGAPAVIDDEQRTSIRLALEALIGNLRSFSELLRALDPLPVECIDSLPHLPHE